MGDIIINLVFIVLGIIIGRGMRNSYAESKEARTYEQVDEQVRNELTVTKNLNKSLLDDVRFLREKLKRLQG
jgi:uncharacterized protein YoxC